MSHERLMMSVPSEVASVDRASGVEMTAVTHDRYGPPEVLKGVEYGSAALTAAERGSAASVDGRDLSWRVAHDDGPAAPGQGRFRSGPASTERARHGCVWRSRGGGIRSELSAVRTASLRHRARIFRRVCGGHGQPSCAGTSRSSMTPKPGVLAESGLTALQALDRGGINETVRPGTRVLIIGASGGVGSLAVQIAALRGLT